MYALLQDIRFAIRTLLANKGFAAVAVLTLAIGIGANTAIFSVVDATLLRPLPFRNPERLVLIEEGIPKISPGYFGIPAPDVLDFQRENKTLDQTGAFVNQAMNAAGASEPVRVAAARVTANMFSMLGASPSLGRTFTTEEDQPGHEVAVLSHGLWRRLLGGDPHAVGSTLRLDGRSYQVIGVMPEQFVFPPAGMPRDAMPAELWTPMAFTREELSHPADNFNFTIVASAKPGVSVEQASADANRVAKLIERKYPKSYTGGFTLRARAVSLSDLVVGRTRTMLLILLGAVAFVLLIACANVANLLLSRAAARRKEIAVRLALGAGRGRLARQLLTESVTLAVLGGALGILLAQWGLRALVGRIPPSIPLVNGIQINVRVLAFAAALTLLTGVVFGIFPALAASRDAVGAGMNESSRGSTAGKKRSRMRMVFAASEVSFALILVTGAGLLVRSFAVLRDSDPGFRPAHVLSMSVPLPESQYQKPADLRNFEQTFLAKATALPGVREAGASSALPLNANWSQTILPEGMAQTSGVKIPIAFHTIVLGHYFEALGIRLRKGRYFNEQDGPGAVRAVVVSETMARRFWPNQDPIGRRVQFGGFGADAPWWTVVGVVADVKAVSLEESPYMEFYQNYGQMDDELIQFAGRSLSYVLRTSSDAAALAPAVRATLHTLDASLPAADLKTMDTVVGEASAGRRFNTFLMSLFAGIALLLAAVGIYGVMAYTVTLKTQEIGIRMALGASRTSVLKVVFGQASTIAGAGIGIGLIGAFALTRLMRELLYEVQPWDPATFLAVSLFLAVVALAAAYFPAMRAMRVDPTVALRCE